MGGGGVTVGVGGAVGSGVGGATGVDGGVGASRDGEEVGKIGGGSDGATEGCISTWLTPAPVMGIGTGTESSGTGTGVSGLNRWNVGGGAAGGSWAVGVGDGVLNGGGFSSLSTSGLTAGQPRKPMTKNRTLRPSRTPTFASWGMWGKCTPVQVTAFNSGNAVQHRFDLVHKPLHVANAGSYKCRVMLAFVEVRVHPAACQE